MNVWIVVANRFGARAHGKGELEPTDSLTQGGDESKVDRRGLAAALQLSQASLESRTFDSV